jgi:CHAT domain-containing protein
VYVSAVDLCLIKADPRAALDYAERAKSRALLSLISHRIDLHLQARSLQDQPLVQQLLVLRERRDRLYRRWETGETPGSDISQEPNQQAGQAARHEARQQIVAVEDGIQRLWHRLLVRNVSYADQASLWQVYTQLDQSRLGPETVLVEYYTLADSLAVFVVSAEAVTAVRLPVAVEFILDLQQRLQHNFGALQQVPQLAEQLTTRVQAVLHCLYQALIEPIEEQLAAFKSLIIVPHNILHYLPFHALYDGQAYLLDRYQMSYLPGSSFLGMSSSGLLVAAETLVMGNTLQGRLSHIQAEVRAVAGQLETSSYIDDEATRVRFQERAPASQVIHVAAHGDFRPDNPLFSGLHLFDGVLTTLDVFNMRLSASLVTLSGCQTGRSVIGGGDELSGLMRAFLASGVSSLVLSLWRVEDAATTRLMTAFYALLSAGQSKVSALRQAQAQLIAGEGGIEARHPYYWAPFFLVGDAGHI